MTGRCWLAPVDMLALLQRALVLLVLALALGGWWLGAALQWPVGWRLALLAVTLLPHAPVMAFEFALLAWLGRSAPAPRPSAMQLLRAWWGEVWGGVEVFGWRQPFRAQAEPDDVDATRHAGRRGVVLVHGFVCNRGLWNPWLRRLRQQGVPFVAVNLEPVFGAIDAYPPIIEAAVARLRLATGLAPLIVAHSMGGLATRAWLRSRRADLPDGSAHGSAEGAAAGTGGRDRQPAAQHVLTVGTPHHGTWLARWAMSPNARQMRQASPWLRELAADEAQQPRPYAHFTCFWGHCDNIVFPAATATLEGAANHHLPGVAHVHMLTRPAVFAALQQLLKT